MIFFSTFSASCPQDWRGLQKDAFVIKVTLIGTLRKAYLQILPCYDPFKLWDNLDNSGPYKIQQECYVMLNIITTVLFQAVLSDLSYIHWNSMKVAKYCQPPMITQNIDQSQRKIAKNEECVPIFSGAVITIAVV